MLISKFKSNLMFRIDSSNMNRDELFLLNKDIEEEFLQNFAGL